MILASLPAAKVFAAVPIFKVKTGVDVALATLKKAFPEETFETVPPEFVSMSAAGAQALPFHFKTCPDVAAACVICDGGNAIKVLVAEVNRPCASTVKLLA